MPYLTYSQLQSYRVYLSYELLTIIIFKQWVGKVEGERNWKNSGFERFEKR